MPLHKLSSLIYISILSKTVCKDKPFIAVGILASTIAAAPKDVYVYEIIAVCLRVLIVTRDNPTISFHEQRAGRLVLDPALVHHITLLSCIDI